MHRHKLPAIAVVAVSALLAGCGGSGPSDAIDDQIAAFGDADAEGVCALYSDAYIEERYGSEEDPEAACVEEIDSSLSQASEEELQTLEDTEVEITEETDTSATAEVTTAGETSTLTLVKEGDDWLIDSEE